MYRFNMGKKLDGRGLEKVSINFPSDLWKKLRVKAAEEDTTITQLLVQMVEQELGIPKNKRRIR